MKQRGKKKKELKQWGHPQGPLGQCEMPQHSNHRSPRRRRQKEKPWKDAGGDNSWKLPQNGEGNSLPSPRNPESPKQDKPKAKHPKTHIIVILKINIWRRNHVAQCD